MLDWRFSGPSPPHLAFRPNPWPWELMSNRRQAEEPRGWGKWVQSVCVYVNVCMSCRLPADYVFVVEEVPHESFTREGNDLRYRHKIRYPVL